MENRIKISDFAKLTGSTLKTILNYHKIGLQSLRFELLYEKKSLEERVAKIEKLLSVEDTEDAVLLDEDVLGSPSFQMTTKILEPDQVDKYARTCPEILD